MGLLRNYWYFFSVSSVNVTWQLSVTVYLDAAYEGVIGTLLLSIPQMSRSQKVSIKLSKGLQNVSFSVMSFTEKDDIKPWWPHGYGKPNLYTAKVKYSLVKIKAKAVKC